MIDRLSHHWSVIVAGRWNRAILTPLWIGKNLLGAAEGEDVRLDVPMDSVGPYRVSHAGLAVMADHTGLRIDVERSSFEDLRKAVDAARKALDELPRTPVAAAGINLYQPFETESEISYVDTMWTSDFDDRLSNGGYSITDRMAVRRLGWRDAYITLRISKWTTDSNECCHGCWFNFEKRSEVADELKEWFSMPITEIEEQVKKMKQLFLSGVTDA